MVKTRILFYVITAISLLAVFSCAENKDPEDKPVEPKPQAGTYTVTIVAGKEAVGTKALSLEGGTLKAVWAVNEEVSVFNETKGAALTGTLKAQSAGTSTTLKGELKGVTIDKNDKLTLQFLSPSYNTQDGTLDYIAAHCDYATANVTVTEVSGSNISTDPARFINQQAFVKILLTEPDGQDRYAPFNPQSLTINYGEGSIELSSIPASTWSSNGAGVVYVAIPAINDCVLSLEAAKTQFDYLFYEKTDVTFSRGHYYELDARMSDLVRIRTEEKLRTALSEEGHLKYAGHMLCLENDISLSKGELTVKYLYTLDLNGKGISGSNKGRIFNVTSTGELTLTGGGMLTQGKVTEDDGGAILNAGSLVIEDVTISDSSASRGGGISNKGTLILRGGSVENNRAADSGGGIFQHREGTLTMSGNPKVYNNVAGESSNNVYLDDSQVITVNGAFTEGASIGVTRDGGAGVFTSGFSAFHDATDDAAMIFRSDNPYFTVSCKNGEASLALWYEITATKNYANLQALLDETGLLNAVGSMAQSLINSYFPGRNVPVSAISYTYWSTDPQGLPVKLSALLYVPDAALGGMKALTGMCLTNHGTIASKVQCPTEKAQFEGAFAWKNYAIVMPDYYGFGASADRPQGYLDAENTAHNSIDAYLAAVQMLEDRLVSIPDRLYSFGYSQGGFNSMANLKYVSQHPELGIQFEKVMCGGSPFDVEQTWNEYTHGTFRNSLAFVPMTLVSINETKQLNIDYGNIFKGSLLDNYREWILSKKYTTSEISRFLSPNPAAPAVIADILHEDLISGQGAAFNALISVIKSYSLTSGWTPPAGTKIFIYHSRQDDTVPYANHTAMKTFLDQAAPGCYTASEGDNGGHMNAVIKYVINTIQEW